MRSGTNIMLTSVPSAAIPSLPCRQSPTTKRPDDDEVPFPNSPVKSKRNSNWRRPPWRRDLTTKSKQMACRCSQSVVLGDSSRCRHIMPTGKQACGDSLTWWGVRTHGPKTNGAMKAADECGSRQLGSRVNAMRDSPPTDAMTVGATSHCY